MVQLYCFILSLLALLLAMNFFNLLQKTCLKLVKMTFKQYERLARSLDLKARERHVSCRISRLIPNFEQLILSLHFVNLTVLSTEPYLFRN